LIQTGNPYADGAIAIEKGVEKAIPAIEEEAPIVEQDTAALIQKAKDLYPKLANKADQAHHVVSKYLGGAKDGITVKIPAAYHQVITNAIREAAPYLPKIQRTAQEVQEILQKVYDKFPLPPH
jgi:hypothetical protein